MGEVGRLIHGERLATRVDNRTRVKGLWPILRVRYLFYILFKGAVKQKEHKKNETCNAQIHIVSSHADGTIACKNNNLGSEDKLESNQERARTLPECDFPALPVKMGLVYTLCS